MSRDSIPHWAFRKVPLLMFLGALAAYLFVSHYLKAYSDPAGWVSLANGVLEGRLPQNRAPLYPVFLALALPLTGPVAIYLVNLPLLLMLVYLLYRVTGQVTAMTLRAGAKEKHLPHLAGFCAAVLFVFLNRGAEFHELLNPYREPFAYSLLFGGISLLLSFVSYPKFWRAAAAATLIGLSAGVREPSILAAIPAALFLFWTAFRRKERRFAGGGAVFVFFLLVGLSPLLVHNYTRSGQALVPSFAGKKAQHMTEGYAALPSDIPVPGMSITYFDRTSKSILKFLWRKYHWWGALLLAAGLLAGLIRRNTGVLILGLPGALLYFFFYSFWWREQWRFYFIIQLFLTIIAAFGAAWLFFLLLRPFINRHADAAVLATAISVWLLTAFGLQDLYRANRFENRLKVWHAGKIRAAILPRLEKPALILGKSHHATLLGTLLGISRTSAPLKISRSQLREDGPESSLGEIGERNRELLSRTNLYLYEGDLKRASLLRQWFDFKPVIPLEGLEPPIERYGKRYRGRIFTVSPWPLAASRKSVSVPGPPGKFLARVDAFRLWDFRERTYCRLSVDGQLVEEKVPNGLHFIEVELKGGRGWAEFLLESDAPLPSSPVMDLFPLNGEIVQYFGLAGLSGWHYPLLAGGFSEVDLLHNRSALLRESGTLLVPTFSGREMEVFARFKVELSGRKDKTPLSDQVLAESGPERVRALLSRPGLSNVFTVGLGRGSGGLELRPIKFTFAPADGARGVVKFYSVTVNSMPRAVADEKTVEVGEEGDEFYLKEGFYQPEKHGKGAVARWTDGRGVVRIPLAAQGKRILFSVHLIDAIPKSVRVGPTFSFNDHRIEAGDVRSELNGEETIYRFEFPAGAVKGNGRDVLAIVSPPWVPAELGYSDRRQLGSFVNTITYSLM